MFERDKTNHIFNSTENSKEEEFELVYIQVGKEFPLFKDSFPRLKGTEGVMFEALESGNGFVHSIYYPDMTSEEVYTFTKLPVKVKILESIEGYLLILLRYGNTDNILEIAFDPTLYKDARALQLAGGNHIVNTYCIDSNTNILKGIRFANLPLKLIQKCREVWSKAILKPNYSEGYTKWYMSQRKHHLKKLWKQGVDVGSFGESYDLNEIYHQYKED